jgi:hypothetical protein
MLELVESCLVLIQAAVEGAIPLQNPRLIKCVRMLYDEKPIGYAPFDLYRPFDENNYNVKDLALFAPLKSAVTAFRWVNS